MYRHDMSDKRLSLATSHNIQVFYTYFIEQEIQILASVKILQKNLVIIQRF